MKCIECGATFPLIRVTDGAQEFAVCHDCYKTVDARVDIEPVRCWQEPFCRTHKR